MTSDANSDFTRPTFTRPPVTEVVASVTFDGLRPGAEVYPATFWKDVLREEFPGLQTQPPFPPLFEQFDSPSNGLGMAGASFFMGSPSPRLWCMSTDETELLQIQPGWFACNWRKVKPEGQYDRWENRRSNFSKWFTLLQTYLVKEGYGEPRAVQCEVTYINQIHSTGEPKGYIQLLKYFNIDVFGGPSNADFESANAEFSYVLRNASQPYGRLHIKATPALTAESEPIYILELTARGLPIDGNDLTAALRFLDLGRLAINEGFMAMTSSVAHEEWGVQ